MSPTSSREAGRWKTRVGAPHVGRTSRTSPSVIMRWKATASAGLALRRVYQTYQSTKRSSCASTARSGVLGRRGTRDHPSAPPTSSRARRPLFLGHHPGIVGRPEATRGRVVERERARALRVGGRERARRAACLPVPAQSAARSDPTRVHHGPHVVHPGLEVGQLAHGIGETGAALVEEDQPEERGKPVDVVDEQRLLPGRQEVGRACRARTRCRSAVAHHLVRDGDVAGMRAYVNLRDVSRRKSHI